MQLVACSSTENPFAACVRAFLCINSDPTLSGRRLWVQLQATSRGKFQRRPAIGHATGEVATRINQQLRDSWRGLCCSCSPAKLHGHHMPRGAATCGHSHNCLAIHCGEYLSHPRARGRRHGENHTGVRGRGEGRGHQKRRRRLEQRSVSVETYQGAYALCGWKI
jgi:hypothetical protein